MVEPYVISSIVYGSLFGMMAMGLTLTYLTTKVPNFAYGSFVTIGIYVSFALYRVNRIGPYVSAPMAFVIGGLTSVIMYFGVLRVLARRGSSLVALMISTLAIDIAFIGVFGIYSDYLYSHYRIADSRNFPQLFDADFSLFGVPGIVYTAPISLALVTLSLYLLLTKTKFGVAMRASVENPNLAKVLGIDVEKTYAFAWFLAGGLAAMSGCFYVLWQPGGTSAGSNLIVEVFASSVLGGLANIYGAVLGGVIIGVSEILLTTLGSLTFGPGVAVYQKGIPLLIMIASLLVLPRGIVSLKWRRIDSRLILRMIEWLRLRPARS